MTPVQSYNQAVAAKLVACLEKRNMEAYYCSNKEEALKKVMELIPDGSTVAWGGSQTLSEVGVIDSLKKTNCTLFDRDTAKSPREKTELMKKAFFSDYYLASINAISADGELVNIDGMGNRTAAIIYGPENVILIAGMNKIEPNLGAAILRAKNNAAIANVFRLNLDTPCTKAGKCIECFDKNSICSQVVITRMSKIKNRIKVILVGETLGF